MDDKTRDLVKLFACNVLGAHKFTVVEEKQFTFKTHTEVVQKRVCDYCGLIERPSRIYYKDWAN